jgi:hypothetical protein
MTIESQCYIDFDNSTGRKSLKHSRDDQSKVTPMTLVSLTWWVSVRPSIVSQSATNYQVGTTANSKIIYKIVYKPPHLESVSVDA